MNLVRTNKEFLYSITMDIGVIDLSSVVWTRSSGFNSKRLKGVGLESLCNRVYDSCIGLLDHYWALSSFRSMWAGTSRERMASCVRPFVELDCDEPGFDTGVHIDHRCAVITGMISLGQGTPTEFYNTRDRAGLLTVDYSPGAGWVLANSHDSWHRGYNSDTINRYSLKFGLDLIV